MAQNGIRNSNDVNTPETNPSETETIMQIPNSATLTALSQPNLSIGGGINNSVLVKLGVEPSLTVREAAGILRWSYWKARRYFRRVEGICVCYQPRRYKRAYRTFTIPISIFAREWQKMTGQQPESTQLIRQRLLTLFK
jgi:AraC-like DNA-binding protein